jgi:hypothetical protein
VEWERAAQLVEMGNRQLHAATRLLTHQKLALAEQQRQRWSHAATTTTATTAAGTTLLDGVREEAAMAGAPPQAARGAAAAVSEKFAIEAPCSSFYQRL